MRCPKCGCVDDKVIDSRSSKDGLAIRRRRQCLECTQRFTTYEEIERGILMVIKDDGAREKFNREKLETGINVACEKRPISAEAIEEMIREVVDELYDEFDGEVPSKVIGRKVVEKLGGAWQHYGAQGSSQKDINDFFSKKGDQTFFTRPLRWGKILHVC